ADDIFLRSRHPYTLGLMRSVPRLDRPRGARLETIEGLPPNLLAPPEGCRFAPRCAHRIDICARDPALAPVEDGHSAACWRAAELETVAAAPAASGAAAAMPAPTAGAPLL